MNRLGTAALMCFAFTVGFVFAFSCGGGGSSAVASGDADTLQGHPAADFALAGQAMPGAVAVTPPDFAGGVFENDSEGLVLVNVYNSLYEFAPVHLPFECVINALEIKVRDTSNTGSVEVTLSQGGTDHFTLSSGDAAWSNSTQIFTGLASPVTDVLFNPRVGDPLYMTVHFSNVNTVGLNLYWVKVHYSIP